MELTLFDGLAFAAFIAVVIGVSLYASRKEDSSEDYFLAGRNLTWWLIGFSLIASNISSEHFVGMAGSGFSDVGLAIASYEWIAAISLVLIGLFLLPLYLRLGIYTMPEFLEHRYGVLPRAIMAAFMMIMYVVVAISSILYAGAVALTSIFGFNLTLGVWLIGILAGAYTVYGGLKAVVWSDLMQGAALLLGGLLVLILGFSAVGGVGAFFEANSEKLHMILPADNPEIPWTALCFGIWIPNLFYWGCNQFITQRTLGARSLAEGQRGVVFAACLKLLMPFIIVFPGIMAYQLYADQITSMDEAYPVLITNILPAGLRGIFFAALFGAVMSSLDSMLNSASTIFTYDLFKRHFRPDSDHKTLIVIGRSMTAVFVLIGCLIAPNLDDPRFGGIFRYIQMFQGFISPGILTVFLFGIAFRRAPSVAASVALILNVIIYGLLLWFYPGMAFLNHMAITFVILVITMGVFTYFKPLPKPVLFEPISHIDLTPSRTAKWLGLVVCLATVGLYIIFW